MRTLTRIAKGGVISRQDLRMTYLGYDLTLEMSLNSEDDKIHFVYSILYVLKRRFLSLKSFLTLRRDKSVTNIDNEKSW